MIETPGNIERELEQLQKRYEQMLAGMATIIVGQRSVLEELLVTVFVGGHNLLEEDACGGDFGREKRI